MIISERMVDFINSMDFGHGDFCDNLAKEARKNQVPIIKKETAALLKTVVTMQQPRNILEVGTAVGYSTLIMEQAVPNDCHITTIEKYEPRIKEAKNNFIKSKKQEKITLLEGDATDILKELKGKYDFVFMDAAKGQYLNWLSLVLPLLAEGGVLFSDNILQDGDIVESRFCVERRNRTIHSRMREYLYTLKRSEELETSIIPIGDGVALSVKKKVST